MNFQQFYEQRQAQHVGELMDALYIRMLGSGTDFNEFWTEAALPVLSLEHYQTEDELVEALHENFFKNLLNKGRDWLTGMNDDQRSMLDAMNQHRQSIINQQQSVYDQEHAQKYGQKQQGLDQQKGQYTQQLKQAFGVLDQSFQQALQTYVQAAQQYGQQIGNPAAGRVANALAKQLKTYHQQASQQMIRDRLQKAMGKFNVGQPKKAELSPADFVSQYVSNNPVAGRNAP